MQTVVHQPCHRLGVMYSTLCKLAEKCQVIYFYCQFNSFVYINATFSHTHHVFFYPVLQFTLLENNKFNYFYAMPVTVLSEDQRLYTQ